MLERDDSVAAIARRLRESHAAAVPVTLTDANHDALDQSVGATFVDN